MKSSGGSSPGTSRPMITDLFSVAAERHPDKTAVSQKDRVFTYAEIAVKIKGVSATLGSLPLTSSDRVIIALNNEIWFIVAYFGVLEAGLVPVIIRTDMPPVKTAAIISSVEPVGVIGHSRVFHSLPKPLRSIQFAFLDEEVPGPLSDTPDSMSLE